MEEEPAPPYVITVHALHAYWRARLGFVVANKITGLLWSGVKAGRLHRNGFKLRSTHRMMAENDAPAGVLAEDGSSRLPALSAAGLGIGLGGELAVAARQQCLSARDVAQATRERREGFLAHRLQLNAAVYDASVAASHRRLRFLVDHQHVLLPRPLASHLMPPR